MARVISVRTLEVLQWANWQRAGNNNAPKPTPFPVPEALKPKGDTDQKGAAAPAEDIRKFLERKNGR